MPHRYWNANIGDPAGDYFQVGTVFERDFTNGKVVVNATSTGVSVDLGGSYRLVNRYAFLQALDLTARVQNALNEGYAEVRGFPALGINALVGLRASF